MHTDGRSVDVGGAAIHTQVLGDPAGPTLFFLHGGLGTLADFAALLEGLSDCKCVFMDSRGHGASGLGDERLTYPRLTEDAATVIAALGLVRPVVIGYSDGGITGVRLAARRDLPLAGLISIGGQADPPEPALMERTYAKLSAQKWRDRFPDDVALYERLNPAPDLDAFFEWVTSMWRDTRPGNYPGGLAREVRCPALVIGGDEDRLVPRMDTVALAAAIPGARLGILPFGTHFVHKEHPERVLPYIRSFLETVTA
jgi:valacyclovir hydrolase